MKCAWGDIKRKTDEKEGTLTIDIRLLILGGVDLISQIGFDKTFSTFTGGFYCTLPWRTRKKYPF